MYLVTTLRLSEIFLLLQAIGSDPKNQFQSQETKLAPVVESVSDSVHSLASDVVRPSCRSGHRGLRQFERGCRQAGLRRCPRPISKVDARATAATGNFIARYIWQLSRSKS